MLVTTEGLRPPGDATTVRVRGDQVLLTDGPFADTKEVIGGFSLVECADLDEALAVTAGIPPPGTAPSRSAAVRDVTAAVDAAVTRAFREDGGRSSPPSSG